MRDSYAGSLMIVPPDPSDLEVLSNEPLSRADQQNKHLLGSNLPTTSAPIDAHLRPPLSCVFPYSPTILQLPSSPQPPKLLNTLPRLPTNLFRHSECPLARIPPVHNGLARPSRRPSLATRTPQGPPHPQGPPFRHPSLPRTNLRLPPHNLHL